MTGNDRIHAGTLVRAFAMTLCVLLAAAPALAGPAQDAAKAAEERRWADAADAWATVLEKKPKDRAAALGLADAAIRAKATDHYPSAEDSLRDLHDANEKDVDVMVALGELCLATSAAKEDTLAKKSYDVEAQQFFERALRTAPKHDGAAGGLAQTYYQMGDFANAVKTVDDFLALKPEKPAQALYWKGQTLYLQALDAFAAGGNKLTAGAQDLFRKAQGAYQASAHVDGSEPQTWIQLAYASAYLGDVPTAADAYRKAALLDPTDRAPLTGLQSLYTHTPDKYLQVLAELLAKNKDHVWALWHYADNRYRAQDWKKARELYARYGEVAPQGAPGYYAAGLCAAAQNDDKAAERLYYKALAADPTHAQAAFAIQKMIMASGAEQTARGSVKGAKEVIARFEPLMEAAPEMAWIRNDLGFLLREAYGANARGGDRAQWLPILKACTEVYTEGAELLGEWTAEKERTYDWAKRYAEAQMINDTGLMYQFYPETKDYDTAERYYNIALEYTEDGYRDAYNNLARILTEQERWQDLYDLSMSAAESITTESGAPDNATRAAARQVAKRLLESGRAKDE